MIKKMGQLKQRPGIFFVPVGIIKKLLPVILVFAAIHVYAQESNHHKRDFYEAMHTPWEIVYGKKLSAFCSSWVLIDYSEDSLSFRPIIMVHSVYNPSPGAEKAFISDGSPSNITIPVKGKTTLRFTAIDNNKKGINDVVGKSAGVLAETGKYLAIKAKIKYDGSKPKAERVKAKYKIKLIDEKDFPDFSYRYSY